jgi:hypothetical protein
MGSRRVGGPAGGSIVALVAAALLAGQAQAIISSSNGYPAGSGYDLATGLGGWTG